MPQQTIMSELVKAKVLKVREPGYLYYINKEGSICRIKSTNKKKTQ